MNRLMVAVSFIIVLFDRGEGKWVRKDELEDLKEALIRTDLRKVTVCTTGPDADGDLPPFMVVIGPAITKEHLDSGRDIYKHYDLMRKIWEDGDPPYMQGGAFIKWDDRIHPRSGGVMQGLRIAYQSEEYGVARLLTLPHVCMALSEHLGCYVCFDESTVRKGDRANPYHEY